MGGRYGDGSRKEQRDGGVLWTVYVLGIAQALLNSIVYRPAAWLVRHVGIAPGSLWQSDRKKPAWKPPGRYFNYGYALLWLALTVGCLLATSWADGYWSWLFVGMVVFRLIEIVVGRAKMLLDRTHSLILAAERNLIFLVIDSVVAITAVAVLVRQSEGSSNAVDAWIDSLSIFTLNGRPAETADGWSDLSTVAGTFTGLLLAVATLGVILGILENRFKEESGDYVGPLRIERPRRRD